jgi:RNA polymerase sigma-70 factor (family 1)
VERAREERRPAMAAREDGLKGKRRHRGDAVEEPAPLSGPRPSLVPSPISSHLSTCAHLSSDQRSLARIRSGEVRAFEEMVLTYAQSVTAFAWRYLRAEDAAVDLAQDVFAHLWEHRREIVIRGSLRAYLFTAVRNRALNAIAHARVEARWRERATTEELTGLRPPPAADERVERADLAAAVESALRSLSPRAQEVARLRWVDRLSKREIAEVLGIAAPTVSVHLTRAVKRLRTLLRGFGAE